jgi:hypothetical protein
MSSVASAARGSANACCQSGRRSSEPTKAPMNVGSGTGGRMGYISEKPTLSMKARAFSMVRMGLPSRRHFSRRAVLRSWSVIVQRLVVSFLL